LERDDPEIKRIDERLKEIENEREKADRLGKEGPAKKKRASGEGAKEEKKK
jgi:hypothetical protein